MYQKPDFLQVSVKVKDVYANYSTTGCPMDGRYEVNYTLDPVCDPSDPSYTYEDNTYVGLGFAYQCYSTSMP